MNNKVESKEQVKVLKNKLELAINSRSLLETDFKAQMSMLVHFIGKLSQVCKGIDLELDNKLANFRVMLNKSAPLSEIEKQVETIAKLLQKHSKLNEIQIKQMHEQFISSGQSLQKAKGLPDKLRRDLRALLTDSKESKDALIQYVPLLSTLLEFYDLALKSKEYPPTNGLLNQIKQPVVDNSSAKDEELNPVIKKLIKLIGRLELSNGHDNKLNAIKLRLDEDLPITDLLDNFVGVFNLIIAEFQQERETAKTFLSTLSDTLSTVQTAVNNTISVTKSSQEKHAKLNNQLNKQIHDMANVVEKATSLARVKVDINEKLQNIASTIRLKNSFEQQQQNEIENQLIAMKEKVESLEDQGKVFKKRIEDQRVKSLQDALTKLANRGAFDDYFAKQIVRFHFSPFELSLVVLDLDNFKKINDTYGHTAGDKTLQVIANTLTKEIKDDGFIARYGGEEFVLIFSDLDKTALLAKLNRLRSKIARLPFKFKNTSVSITASLGVCHIRENDNVHVAFERADTALYEAKSEGKNRVIYAD